MVPAMAGLQVYPNLEGRAPREDVVPYRSKPMDDHQKESLASFVLYHFLEVLCNMYWLLRVWRVG